MNKFAPMTASLLVRKGAAAPSDLLGPSGHVTNPYAAPRGDHPHDTQTAFAPRLHLRHVTKEPEAHPLHEHERRIMVWIRPEDLERLEIAAIKKGVTRHEIASKAIDTYLRGLAEDFARPCACVSGSCCP